MYKVLQRIRFSAWFVSVIALAAPAALAAPTFMGLGKLTGGENNEIGSFAAGISGDGQVVVGYSGSANGQEAFRWTSATGMVGLGDQPAGNFISAAGDASGDGSVVVGYGHTASRVSGSYSERSEPMRWMASTGMVSLGQLSAAGFGGFAGGISADGSVVVGRSSASDSHSEAFRWTSSGGMVSLGILPGNDGSAALAVSGDGTVVVGHSGSFNVPVETTQAIRWTQSEGMQGLGDLPGGAISSDALGISADGSVIVGWGSNAAGAAPFRWTVAGGMQDLGNLPGVDPHGYASDASADGSVIVGLSGATDAAFGGVAFIWDEQHGMRDLRQLLVSQGADLTGWTLREAAAISDDGLTIVGTGINPNGQTEAWIATIPEPSTLALLALALPFLSCRRRRGKAMN